MASITVNPSSNTTPDPAQGGAAVAGNINTGHGSTICSDGVGGGATTKTCIWTGFPASGGQVSVATLKLDWTENGSIPDGTNSFTIEYSLNGGAGWNSLISHVDISSSNSGSSQVSLAPSQNLTQVQVRDKLSATAGTLVASVTTSVSNIRIELTTIDATVIVIM